ncbi:hypothetical protein [Rhizobium mongolense]|uniref:Uncharacterized protein n=2 Tax=Rhizobium mongolense TaxID=57676 RepID=A0ABR6ISM6_9HYPH|nr:hypothetical protein [Rhizobium mongolense]MBB4230881.1 hypothetical protein [Rhizobium mongolense]TVZ66040.1 hypothetical protein BCL32_6387 [Rhizobium mongolense USDA 1844]
MSGGKQESADKVKRMRKNDGIAGFQSLRRAACVISSDTGKSADSMNFASMNFASMNFIV